MYESTGRLGLDGHFIVEHVRDGRTLDIQHVGNRVVDEGLTHVLEELFNSGPQITAWYIGIYETNYTPQADDAATNIASRSVESTAYDEGTRILFQSAAATGLAVTNAANRAVFTCNASKIMYGLLLASNSGRQSTLGSLLSVALFDNARTVEPGDELLVTYTMNAQDV